MRKRVMVLAASAALIAAMALSSCDNRKAEAPVRPQAIDYGVLGKPSAADYTDIDPQITKRTAADNLALFRKNVTDPPQGTPDQPMNAQAVEEQEDYRRALFYSAAERAPELVAPQDWQAVREVEKDLISSSCASMGTAMARYELSEKDCEGVK